MMVAQTISGRDSIDTHHSFEHLKEAESLFWLSSHVLRLIVFSNEVSLSLKLLQSC